MKKKMRGLNSVNGTLMSGLEMKHDTESDRLSYPGAANALQHASAKAMGMRLKKGKLPGYTTAPLATQMEAEDFINGHEKADLVKEEVAFNNTRRKANKPALLGLAPAGAAIGAALPMAGASVMEAINSKKGDILNGAMRGAKSMIAPGAVTDGNSFVAKYGVPLAGAGVGLAGGVALAGKLNSMHRDKVVGKKKTEALNDISYDLDNHMREKETIKRIADNSTYKALKNRNPLTGMEKSAEEKKKNVALRATGAGMLGAAVGSQVGAGAIGANLAVKASKKGITDVNRVLKIYDKIAFNKKSLKTLGGSAAAGAGIAAINSVRKNMLNNVSVNNSKNMEKKAGLKRDLRIARAEANAKTPKLMSGYRPSNEDIQKYKEEMAQYGDSIESFLNSKDKNQDWNTKKKLAKLSIAQGESGKNTSVSSSTKSFVNKRIFDKHSNGNLNRDNTFGESYIRENMLQNHPKFNGFEIDKPSVKQRTPADRLKEMKEMGRGMEDYAKYNTRHNITGNDTALAKQLESGKHPVKKYNMQDLKQDGVYFKTHSESSPFNLAGNQGQHIKRDFTGNPKVPKNGVPIWASKLPEVSTSYGDTVLAFKPNKSMIDGASPIDHPHLATDTRKMTKKQIEKTRRWNPSFELNANPDYERVFTYDRKNMDKSTVATYSKNKVGKGGRFDQDAWEFTKNKPGSLADSYARRIVNGQQDGYANGKRLKQLDRKALKRKASSVNGAVADTVLGGSSVRQNHQLPSKMRELAKSEAFRKNMLGAVGIAGTAGLAGYGVYNGIKKAKAKKEFLKQKEQEKKASQVHHELMIEKFAIRG